MKDPHVLKIGGVTWVFDDTPGQESVTLNGPQCLVEQAERLIQLVLTDLPDKLQDEEQTDDPPPA